MVTTGLLVFIGAWNEFLFALTFTSTGSMRTVPVAIGLLSAPRRRKSPGADRGGIRHRDRAADRPRPIFQRKIVAGP